MTSIKNKRVLIGLEGALSSDDISALSLLYGPLSGPTAVALYLSLESLMKKGNFNTFDFNHTNLFDLLNLTESKFLDARHKLEALNLLETYESNDSIFYYLYKPQSAKQFVRNGVLGIFLSTQIGRENLKKILSLFDYKKEDIDSFKNVSKTFEDVFKITNDEKLDISDLNLSDNVYAKTIELKNTEFNFDEFVKNIDIHFLKTGVTESFKSNVLSIAKAYDLDISDMISCYNESIDSTGEFNSKFFRTKARKIYNALNGNKKPLLKDKEDVPEIDSDLLNEFKNFTTEEILEEATLKADAATRATLATIYNGIPLDKTIVNMMVVEVGRRLHELPKLPYFEQMYNTMSELGVTSPSLAKAYLFDGFRPEKEKKKYKKNTKSSNQDDDWVDQSAKDLLKELGIKDD